MLMAVNENKGLLHLNHSTRDLNLNLTFKKYFVALDRFWLHVKSQSSRTLEPWNVLFCSQNQKILVRQWYKTETKSSHKNVSINDLEDSLIIKTDEDLKDKNGDRIFQPRLMFSRQAFFFFTYTILLSNARERTVTY